MAESPAADERPTARAVIEQLALAPHPEGGYFRRTYTSAQRSGDRPAMSAIFYLLTAHSNTGHLHCNRSDILHFWQAGGALRYTLLHPGGELEQVVLGPDLSAGQCLQLRVAGGVWKASELLDGDYGLISEAVCPGFDDADQRMASAELLADYPQHRGILAPLLP